MKKISVTVTVNSDVGNVWSAWTTPSDINQWNAASDDWHNPRSTNDLRVGGKFSYRMEAKDGSSGFDFEGTYTKIIQNKQIEYILGDGRTVSVMFEPVEGGIRLSETFDAEDQHSAELQRDGWQNILKRFAAYVESKKKRS